MSSLDLSLVLSSASEQNTASVTVQIFFFSGQMEEAGTPVPLKQHPLPGTAV